MKAWSVVDTAYSGIQVAVVSESPSRAKSLGLREFRAWGDDDISFTDLRVRMVRSPIPVSGPERIIDDLAESLQYGFRWNNEAMADVFDDWYSCWLAESDGT